MDTTPAATGPITDDITLVNAGQEYGYPLWDGLNTTPSVKKIQVRCSDDTHTFQYAWQTGGPYFHVRAGEVYYQDGLDTYASNIYFKSANAGEVIEIEVWK